MLICWISRKQYKQAHTYIQTLQIPIITMNMTHTEMHKQIQTHTHTHTRTVYTVHTLTRKHTRKQQAYTNIHTAT